MSNKTVLEKTNSCSITAILKQRRFRCLDHVYGMTPESLPSAVSLSQIPQTNGPVGHQCLGSTTVANDTWRMLFFIGKRSPAIDLSGAVGCFLE